MPKLADIVCFRRDLLFNGAVQLGWLESDRPLAEKAAQHFAFHGPQYHGVARDASQADGHQLLDTASFTVDLLKRITGRKPGEPFVLAVAGYGTGKSHLGVTLACLLGSPDSPLADRILDNLSSADSPLGDEARAVLSASKQPFLVVALNGMKDFDLTAEVVRQVMVMLQERGLDTSPLDDLRPRFRQALGYITEEIFNVFRDEFEAEFGPACRRDDILDGLGHQDEAVFDRVHAIFQRKMGMSIRATGQESIHDFLRAVREAYCGEDRPFAGLLILFDEFGRYMEFAVHRPLIAGSGALQQLYEAVQANGEGVFLLNFIQYELRAYVSRVAPELRDELERYVSRYDGVRKVRLSTNLETLIANLLEKTDPELVAQHVAAITEAPDVIRGYMRRWFPDLDNYAVWANTETFDRVIRRGCWPLHPLSTWLLYKLAAVGKSLHQRSALSLLADVYDRYRDIEPPMGFSLAPADLCSDDLVNEFIASERFGQQGPSAQAFQAALARHEHVLSGDEIRVLKAVLLLAKVGARIPARGEWLHALALFGGCTRDAAERALRSMERDRGILTWNEALGQYEILSEGVPRAKFLAFLEAKTADIPAHKRGELFSANFGRWFPEQTNVTTDFGVDNEIATKEWNFSASFGNVPLLPSQVEISVASWQEARAVDESKGRLIYCYVGPDSDLAAVRSMAETRLRACVEKAGIAWDVGAPISVCLLHDEDGSFANKVAEYSLLRAPMDPIDAQRFANFLQDHKDLVEQELRDQFEQLRRQRHLVFATAQPITGLPLKAALARLFDVVYSQRIPFPFDGFSVPGGTAARCNQQFTRQLFLGQFDREWIATRPVQEKNRAHQVLVQSWQVLDADGRLRIRPGNPAVQRLVDFLDSALAAVGAAPGQFNLGKVLRTLCAPPYGCNLASAGLLLAFFFGGRKDSLGLLRGGQRMAMESWLQTAMPHNYLELAVLDQTVVLQVQAPDEWLRLLNDWGLETSFSGRATYLRKARELEERIPIPAAHYFWYDNLRDKAKDALTALAEHENKLDEALQRVQRGSDEGQFYLLCWGAADLARLEGAMQAKESLWTASELAEVQRPLAQARIAVQQRFPAWLPRERATSIAELSGWVHRRERDAENLQALDLGDERNALNKHIEEVESAIRFLNDVETIASEVKRFIGGSAISDSIDILALNGFLGKAADFEDQVTKARLRNMEAVRTVLDSTQSRLDLFKQQCKAQISAHKQSLEDAYNQSICTIDDISDLRARVSGLKQVFAGQDADLSGIVEIAKELEIVERDYRQIDGDALSDAEFDALLERCSKATGDVFEGEPPLYTDPYEGIATTIRARRRRAAEEWMRTNVPGPDAISNADAEQARGFRTRLQNAPRLLSDSETRLVQERLAACERRMDQLEVEGMVTRFGAIPDPWRKSFLQDIWAQGLLAELCKQVGCDKPSSACYQGDPESQHCPCPLFRV